MEYPISVEEEFCKSTFQYNQLTIVIQIEFGCLIRSGGYLITLRSNSFTDQRLEHYIAELVNVEPQREFRVRGHA